MDKMLDFEYFSKRLYEFSLKSIFASSKSVSDFSNQNRIGQACIVRWLSKRASSVFSQGAIDYW